MMPKRVKKRRQIQVRGGFNGKGQLGFIVGNVYENRVEVSLYNNLVFLRRKTEWMQAGRNTLTTSSHR